MIPGNAPRPSDSDSSVELMLEDRRTIINFSDALAATHEDGEDYDHDDDDSEFNFTERNAEVTFDGALDYGDEHEATMDPGVDAAIAPGSKSKTWNRFLRRSRPKGGSTAEKKSHTLGDHFRPSAFSKARAGNQREHTLKHFHLSRNRSAKQEAKPTEQLLLRYRLCPYALPSLHEVHAHFGSELNSWNALPKADIDDRNSKYSTVIATHFRDLSDVAREMNSSPSNGDSRPGRRASNLMMEGSLTASPTRRNSDPAKADAVSAIEQARMEMRRSEFSHWPNGPDYSNSKSHTTPSGFTFASLDDPVLVGFADTDDDSRQDSRDCDEFADDVGRPSESRWSIMKTPPPSRTTTTASNESEDVACSPTSTATPASSKTSRFRKLAHFRSKNGNDKSAATDPTTGLPRTYSLLELQSKGNSLPGVDVLHKEDALTDEEFEKIFKCTRTHFRALPQWRRTMLKKEHGLF